MMKRMLSLAGVVFEKQELRRVKKHFSLDQGQTWLWTQFDKVDYVLEKWSVKRWQIYGMI